MKILIADDKKDSEKIHELYAEWSAEKVSPKTLPLTLKELAEQLKKSTTFIAKEADELVGFLICKIKKSKEDTIMYHLKKGEEYAELDSIYIKKNHRKKGIGTALINSCRAELKKHNYKKLIVLADSIKPKELMSFYEKNGFETLFVSMISDKL